MKKYILLLIVTILLFNSCGRKKSEQMLYDYQQKNLKTLNFDLEDLNFKIHKIEKIKNILAADSLKIIKKELAEYWKKNPEQSLIDTLSFKYVKKIINNSIKQNDTLAKLYQKSLLTAIKLGDYSFKVESKTKRDEVIDELYKNKKLLIKVEELEKYYNKLSVKPDSVISSKYLAKYSMKNPLLGNVKQTFEKFFYSDPVQTKFIKEELVNEDK